MIHPHSLKIGSDFAIKLKLSNSLLPAIDNVNENVILYVNVLRLERLHNRG